MNTYGRLPIALSHGQGCRVWDTAGREYLDALGGIAVNTVGHNHPQLVAALQDQVTKLIHLELLPRHPAGKSWPLLVERSGMTNVFSALPGWRPTSVRSNWHASLGTTRASNARDRGVRKAFHGRSIATLGATANPKIHAGLARW